MVSVRSLFAYFWKDQFRVLYFAVCCCVVLLLAYKKHHYTVSLLRDKIVLPAILILVMFGNPISAHILVSRTVETQSLRFFWLIPISLFLAAATVVLLDFVPGRRVKVVVAAIIIPILLLSGNGLRVLRKNWQYDTPNWYKIPPVVIELCDYIMEDDANTEKSLACCFPLSLWVRQYESDIYMPFAWYGAENPELWAAMNKVDDQFIDLDLVSQLASEASYSYIVLPREENYIGSMETYGYREVYSLNKGAERDADQYNKEYVIYRLEEGGNP